MHARLRVRQASGIPCALSFEGGIAKLGRPLASRDYWRVRDLNNLSKINWILGYARSGRNSQII